jgi:hypothetical protein
MPKFKAIQATILNLIAFSQQQTALNVLAMPVTSRLLTTPLFINNNNYYCSLRVITESSW